MSWILRFPVQHPAVTLCLYGAIAGGLFAASGTLRTSSMAHYVYVTVLAALIISLGVRTPLSGLMSLMVLLAQGVIGIGFNIPALHCSLDHALTAVGRSALSDGDIKVRKTYDKADGAATRGDFALAAALYREEIADDPKDAEARRRLAEVLLRQGEPEQAVEELRKAMALFSEPHEQCTVIFRLAEVLREELKDDEAAAELYRNVLRQCPKGRHADYARERLARMEEA